jgi:hypothetical protein
LLRFSLSIGSPNTDFEQAVVKGASSRDRSEEIQRLVDVGHSAITEAQLI